MADHSEKAKQGFWEEFEVRGRSCALSPLCLWVKNAILAWKRRGFPALRTSQHCFSFPCFPCPAKFLPGPFFPLLFPHVRGSFSFLILELRAFCSLQGFVPSPPINSLIKLLLGSLSLPASAPSALLSVRKPSSSSKEPFLCLSLPLAAQNRLFSPTLPHRCCSSKSASSSTPGRRASGQRTRLRIATRTSCPVRRRWMPVWWFFTVISAAFSGTS